MHPRPVIVVVAAGRGSRFEASPSAPHKLLAVLDGATVLDRTLRHAVASHLPVVVVTTARLVDAAAGVVALRDIVVVPDAPSDAGLRPELGMGYSIAAGVAARGDASGWLILPADLPLVRPDTLLAVAAALAEHPIAYAQHRGRRGHPVGFSAELYSELVALQGDDGARRIVARYPSQAVSVDDPGALLDVDTADDLAAARAALQAVPHPTRV
jgi:molybdenum cofactor cytidylyltransferase